MPKTIIFVWDEDYKRNFSVFNDNSELDSEEVLPAVQSLIICYPKAGKLKIKAKNNDFIQHLRRTIGAVCLNNPNYFSENSGIELSLSVFKNSIAKLNYDVSKIESVKVTGLKIQKTALKSKTGVEIKVKNDIYTEVKDILKVDLSSPSVIITKVRLHVKLKNRDKKRVVELSTPNHTRLNDTHDDQIIENMLIDWGVIYESRNSSLSLS